MVSIVILTKNEELDIENCLASIRWCDDIHILDSGSTDDTVKIAQRFTTNIVTHPFESFGKQRNYALEQIQTKYDWVLFLDADEVATEAFKVGLTNAIGSATPDVAGFYCCWKMMLDGRWLKRSDNFPKWQFRVVKKGLGAFTDFGHGQKEFEIKGKLLYIKEPYLHFGFSKGWARWISRHNNYSNTESVERLENRPPFKNIFSAHGSMRNPALKSWLSCLPGWPFLRFLQAYIFNLGFMEGKPGFIYCVNMAYYEFLIQIKMREHKNRLSVKT